LTVSSAFDTRDYSGAVTSCPDGTASFSAAPIGQLEYEIECQ
jgi:hypothetical protein